MSVDAPVVPARLNPDLSIEVQLEVNFFLKWGYLVVENALTDEQVNLLRIALDETFERLNSEFTHQLLEQDDRFGFLIDNPPVMERMKAILGNCIQLHRRYRARSPAKSTGSKLASRRPMANGSG